MPAFAGGYHPVVTRATKSEIAEWTTKIRTTVNENIKIRKIAVQRSASMVAKNSENLSFIAMSSVLPAGNFDYGESPSVENLR